MSEATITSIIIGGSGLLITLIFSVFSRSLANDKMRRELFADFNKRYDDLNDDLYRIKEQIKSIEELNKSPLKSKLIDFFNLCAEEFYWRRRLGNRIWKCWHAGMKHWYNEVPVIKEAWEKEIEELGHAAYYLKEKESFFKK